MGHTVQSIDGDAVGGVQWLKFTPDSASPTGGFYRAGSDHRKDGQAAGW
jgi:gamma-glutamyltranspeptidase/glutathione hydrolase